MKPTSDAPLAHFATSSGTRSVRAFGPASLSNLGPGFDAVGLAIEGIGDVVEARWAERPGVRVEAGEGAEGMPLEPGEEHGGGGGDGGATPA